MKVQGTHWSQERPLHAPQKQTICRLDEGGPGANHGEGDAEDGEGQSNHAVEARGGAVLEHDEEAQARESEAQGGGGVRADLGEHNAEVAEEEAKAQDRNLWLG